MTEHQQDLIDLISLVEEYKQHAAQSQMEIKSHKNHISDLEKEIGRFRAKESTHHKFVRELEESVWTLDRQLRHQHVSQSKKDDEIRSLKTQILSMESQMNRVIGSEKRELEILRDERTRLNMQLTLKDQQLHEFERQIDHQQTKILNMKAESPFLKSRADADSEDDEGVDGSKSSSSKKKKNKSVSPIAPISQDDVGLSLFPIGEESPSRSVTSQSPPTEARKSATALNSSPISAEDRIPAEILNNQPQPMPKLTKNLSNGSSSPRSSRSPRSPRSGKVEMISDATEFGAEPLAGTIFSGMLGAAASITSPAREGTGGGGTSKWASPRDESPIAGANPTKSPTKSPPKPAKPPKRQPSTKAPLGISLGINLVSAAASREASLKATSSAAITTTSSGSGRNRDVTLDSSMGMHHSMEQEQWSTTLRQKEKKKSDSPVPLARERTSVESVHTPDTLSPPTSPGPSTLGGVGRTASATQEAKAKNYRYAEESGVTAGTHDGDDEDKEDEEKEEEEMNAKLERGKPKVQERRLKTLSSIKAIMNRSRMNRGLSAGSANDNGDACLPVDMSFERQDRDMKDEESAATLREYIRKSKESGD